MTEPPALALVVATAVHLGFQLVVTFLVYPAFAEVPAEDWRRYHDAHSRRITWIVGPVYGLLVLASAWVLTAGPRNAGTVTAVAACGLAVLITAAVAAPAHGRLGHGRLGQGRGERDLRLLTVADQGRTAVALVALGAAVVGAL